MTERALKINIPSNVFIALNKSEDELKKEMRIFAAMKFYETGKLTIGKAAQLAAMPRWHFENLLVENQIPISNLEIEDIDADLEKMKAL
jgi:predicted HTH domain antitoxin